MEEKKKNTPIANELNDEQLEQVAGGVINVYDVGDRNPNYWKYTCRACGHAAVVNYWPEACNNCHAGNITCVEYKP